MDCISALMGSLLTNDHTSTTMISLLTFLFTFLMIPSESIYSYHESYHEHDRSWHRPPRSRGHTHLLKSFVGWWLTHPLLLLLCRTVKVGYRQKTFSFLSVLRKDAALKKFSVLQRNTFSWKTKISFLNWNHIIGHEFPTIDAPEINERLLTLVIAMALIMVIIVHHCWIRISIVKTNIPSLCWHVQIIQKDIKNLYIYYHPS